MLLPTLVLCLAGAVPGVPEPLPGDTGEAGVLLMWGNDAFGVPPGPDDRRTNQLAAWARWRGFDLCLDDSMLTDHAAAARTDELTATVGYEFAPGVRAGVGYRQRGDYAGDDIQRAAHAALGDGPVPPAAQDGRSGAPLAYFGYLATDMDGGAGYQSVTAALVAADGDLALDQAARGVVTWRWLTVWAGTRYQWRSTPSGAGPAREAVDAYEQGLWVETGVRLGYLAFETRYNPRTGDAVGAVTLFVGR